MDTTTHPAYPHRMEQSRITADDADAMHARAVETLAQWAAAGSTGRYAMQHADAVALARIMAHAIGCSYDRDLRAVERDEIDGEARSYVGQTYDARGRMI